MRKGGGKQKGAAFERKVCAALSRFIDPEGEDTLFWRSAMSGGRSTVQAKQGKKNESQAGDLTCTHPKGFWLTDNYVIECKFYKDLDIKSAILTGRGKLVKFWAQVSGEAQRMDKEPMLIARENLTPTLVLLTDEGWRKMRVFGKMPKAVARAYKIGDDTVVICLYDKLFKIKGKTK